MPLVLEVIDGELRGMIFPIHEGQAITIGRDAGNTIRLRDRKLSRIHCQVEVLGGHCQLTDLNSTNGTIVNDERVYDETWLSIQDRIDVGMTKIRLIEMDDEESSEDALAFRPAPIAPEGAVIRCEECEAVITSEDIAAGVVRHAGNRHYCPKCSNLFAPEPEVDEEIEESAEDEDASLPAGERLEPGTSVAGVRVVSFVGEGRLGPLYEGEQISMGRLVALKVLTVDDSDWARKYLDAVYASGKLVHPNIVLIFDAGEVDDMYYVIREYVEGESIEERMAAHVPVGLDEAFTIVSQVAYALEYAFERRTFHGSLSPRKILLGPNAAVKVTCFGLPQTLPTGVGLSHLRWQGLPYTAPERLADGGKLDFTSDCYSLIAVFYHLLAGYPAFRGSTRERIERNIRKAPPKPLRAMNPNLPPIVEKIVDRGLSKDPRSRFQTPRELLFELEENLRKEL